ncbi:TadE/TadG family type IV pilus assembly protein [Aminobacter ciceronei]|jgi:Flp pilus assembly protein TadG|uniref:Flp pilus assembly protein TadG n=1 Tax=Aminobacter ciceronei TaxID=150723 RepID=A0ABR6CFE0_9HYPH|nr:TadE/TadG family type IV pilus assembly protein [Aminobacter ciceronei]MBA8909991.1 Flp pilus assembly protein TadG [Aminobacter ciceronei]MBA9023763.1 Flp pilus assembly protein TadG [Aminobacter ciceronei]
MSENKYFAYKQYFRRMASLATTRNPGGWRVLRHRRKLGADASKSFTERIKHLERWARTLIRIRPPDSSGFLQSRSGTSAIEFAIVAPVFILLVFGMIAYGIYFGALHSVQQMAADAARTAIGGLNEAERKTLAQRYIDLNGDGYVLIDKTKLTVDAKDSANDSEQFVVSLSYDARQLPIWNLLTMLPMPEQTIKRSSTIRVGGI